MRASVATVSGQVLPTLVTFALAAVFQLKLGRSLPEQGRRRPPDERSVGRVSLTASARRATVWTRRLE